MASLLTAHQGFSSAVQGAAGREHLIVAAATSEGSDILLHHLGLDALQFSAVSVGPIVGGQFVVSGKSFLFGFEHDATLRVTIGPDGGTRLALTLQPTATSWSFQTAFPSLPQSPGVVEGFLELKESCFYDLPAALPHFTVSTFEDSSLGVMAGVSFTVTLDPWRTFPALARLAGSTAALPCRGTIDLRGPFPLFRLEAPLSSLTFPAGRGAIGDLVLALETTAPTAELPARSHAFLRGRIAIGSIAPSLIIEASVLEGDFIWQFVARFAPGLLSLQNGFAELAHLAGLEVDAFHLPPGLDKLSSFSLTEVQVGIEPASKSVSHISFLITSPERWQTPIPGIAIERLGVGWMFMLPPPVHIDAQVFGDLVLGRDDAQFRLEVSAQAPDFEIRASLPEGQKINLRAIFEIYFKGFPFEHELSVEHLELNAQPGDSTYSLEIGVRDDWPIFGRLVLSPLSLTIRSDSGVASCDLRAQFKLDELAFYVHAAYSGGGGGWQFEGGLLPHAPLSMGVFLHKLEQHFGPVVVPAMLENATLEEVAIGFNTASKDFHFSIDAKLPLKEIAAAGDPAGAAGGTDLAIKLSLDLTHHGDTFEKKFAGQVTLGGRTFNLNFAKADSTSGATATTMVAAYQSLAGDKITLKELLQAVGADVSDVPDGLSVTLHSALFALEKPANTKDASWKVFGLNIDGGLNLSNLPLLDRVLPANETLSLEFQALYSSRAIAKTEVESLVAPVNALLPPGATPLPTAGDGDPVIAQGIGLATTLHLGSEVIHLTLPVKIDKSAPKGISGPSSTPQGGASPGTTAGSTIVPPGPAAAPVALSQDGLKWFTIHKSFGPAHFERIGAGLADGRINFALDASLNVGGLSLSLDGLGVSSPLDHFDPAFRLRGIGIDYANGPVEIGGSFLRLGGNNFTGTALIKTEALTLSAIGAYGEVENHTSLFVYAVLDYPLGGPSFFFVTGLAAGFGYNRSLLMPAIEDLPKFPLVSEATAGAGLPKDVMAELKLLNDYLPPDVGQYFLAVGVKFNSFKLIDSFALLAVSFGQRFEIDVLGQSTVVVPAQIPGGAKVDPLARVTIALLARFIPDEGLLAVDARITSGSFILSENCHLTGGFSFYTWFAKENSGDFVLTLGGYHPAFKAPPHYPQVPRLGFTWQVAPELVVKGDAYYALTSHALMAGGHLEATYQSGGLRVYFRVGADFLISWQPYQYAADAYINVGGSYETFLGTISVDLGAQLHLWGPEFAGTAELDLYVATVHASFGKQDRPKISYIEWSKFKTAFLPAEAAVVSLALENGLVQAGDPKTFFLGTINPSELCIVTNSLIPSTKILAGAQEQPGDKVGVAPVGVDSCTSRHSVRIEIGRANGLWDDVSGDFRHEPVVKKMPAALWGAPNGGTPAVNASQKFISGISGLRISPRKVPVAHASQPMRSDLAWDGKSSPIIPLETFSRFSADAAIPPDASPRGVIDRTINAPQTAATRNRYLAALQLDPSQVRVGGLSGMMLHGAPRLGFFAEPTA